MGKRCLKCKHPNFRDDWGCDTHNFDDKTGVCVDCDQSVFSCNARCLHRAVLVDNMATCRYLIEQGSNFRAVDLDGQTVLHISVHCGQDVVLKYQKLQCES